MIATLSPVFKNKASPVLKNTRSPVELDPADVIKRSEALSLIR